MHSGQPRFGRSISFRLGCLVTTAVTIAVVTIGTAMAWHELERFASSRREALFSTASAFSAAVADPLAVANPAAVRQALRAIRRIPGTVEAEVYGADGTLIADLGGAVRLSDDVDLTEKTDTSANLRLLTSHTVKVAVPVFNSGSEIGRLVLVSETGDLMSSLRDVLYGLLAAGILALGIGLGISLRLQRGITGPIGALATKMSSIRQSHDYASSVEVRGDDETAVLASSFNAMISEILERDRALLRHQSHLESEVEARTEDLSRAKAAAEAANQAKSTFLATMSHEIRTPMNGMLAMAELLATSELPPRQKRYAEVISRSGQSLVAIINDILDLSKVEAGKMDLENAPLSVNEVIDTVTALFAERALAKGLDLAAFVSTSAPTEMLGDQVRLTQIISNLVNNALKFTERGHVLIRVLRVDTNLRIEVKDTGIGIGSDKISDIFASFTQAEQSTARRYGGTGLGLSICKKLVEAMGGEIGVESALGVGSTFWASIPIKGASFLSAPPTNYDTLPVRIASSRTALLHASLASLTEVGVAASLSMPGHPGSAFWIVDAAILRQGSGRPDDAAAVVAVCSPSEDAQDLLSSGRADRILTWPISQADWRPLANEFCSGRLMAATIKSTPAPLSLLTFSGARVLVADDSAVNREVASEALRRFGVTAEVVENGVEAVEAVSRAPYDLVLMDGSMPELDGFDATRRIRLHETETGATRTPIVALTAHVLGAQADEWRDAGMDDFLHKPLSISKLELCLRQWLTSGPSQLTQPDIEAPAATDGALLNEETLLQLQDMSNASGGGFARRVFELFEAQSLRLVEALDEAAMRGSASETAKAAHALKSTSLNIGAALLAIRVAHVENAARDHGAVPSVDEIGALRAVLELSRANLSARLLGRMEAAHEKHAA